MLTFGWSSFIISHLQARFSREDICIAYYYCNHKSGVNRGAEGIIASLAKQLADKKSKLPEDLASFYEEHQDDKSFTPTLEQLLALLKTLIASFTRAIIVIDALDECTNERDRRRVISSLQGLWATKVLVTSREPGCHDISTAFSNAGAVRLEIKAMKSDLEMYVRRELEEHQGKLQFITPDLRERIVSTVAGNADGR